MFLFIEYMIYKYGIKYFTNNKYGRMLQIIKLNTILYDYSTIVLVTIGNKPFFENCNFDSLNSIFRDTF